MEIHGGPTKRKRRKPEDPEWLAFMSDDEKEEDRIREWQATSLAEVGLPVRIINTLEDHAIMTIGDLCKQSIKDLKSIPNLGQVTIEKCVLLVQELRLPSNLHKK
jgi:DNA-directed RNA polymerase alpha subunit